MTMQANWIWDAGEPAPRNAVLCFRATFTGSTGAHTLYISADARYILYLNGVRMGYGPARAYQFRYDIDSYPFAPHLRPGTNCIAVRVLHYGEDTFHHRTARGGLLAQIDDAAGNRVLATDSNWRVQRSAAFVQNVPRICVQLPWEEHFDARAEDPAWLAADFVDDTWQPATIVGAYGCAPWGELVPRTIPFLTDEPIAAVTITAQGAAHRPELTLGANLRPFATPGDRSAEHTDMDLLLASVLHLPTAGTIALRRGAIYGPYPAVWLASQAVAWQADGLGATAAHALPAGDHALLLDWRGQTHDRELAIALAGVPGMTASAPTGDGIWAVALHPDDPARQAARRAADATALLASGARWQTLPYDATWTDDSMLDIAASQPDDTHSTLMHLPVVVTPHENPQISQRYVIDFGRMLVGWIAFDVSAAAGTTIDILGAEAMQEGVLVLPELLANSMRYTCRDGRQQYVSAHRRGLRYLVLQVHGAAEPLTIHDIRLQLATYPGPAQGAFRSDDPRLNAIWELSAYTLRLCSEDTFTDCPTYEQTFYPGDARTEALVHAYVHGDPRLAARSLRLAADSLHSQPIVGSQVPSGWERQPIPNWSWLWVVACEDHYQLTGDAAFVKEIYPALAQQAAFVEKTVRANPHGLFALPGAWHFLDWTQLDTAPAHTMAHESALAVRALRATAALAAVCGLPDDATRWNTFADTLAAAVNHVFWSDSDQAFVDALHGDGTLSTTVSQPTNVAVVFCDVAQGARAAALHHAVAIAPPGWVPIGSPFMLGFALEVLAQQGRTHELLQTIRARWGEMLDRGATTLWESFTGQTHPLLWTRSWCHAWAAMPAYILGAWVLGVRPLTPGFGTVLIAPQLGDLQQASGRVPTPHGIISVAFTNTARELVVDISLPPGVAAQVQLPGREPETIAAGATVQIRSRQARSLPTTTI